jgi:hypothetical protein
MRQAESPAEESIRGLVLFFGEIGLIKPRLIFYTFNDNELRKDVTIGIICSKRLSWLHTVGRTRNPHTISERCEDCSANLTRPDIVIDSSSAGISTVSLISRGKQSP